MRLLGAARRQRQALIDQAFDQAFDDAIGHLSEATKAVYRLALSAALQAEAIELENRQRRQGGDDR